MIPADPQKSGGFGLFLVNRLSAAWGVLRDGGGITRVWFELLLDSESAPSQPSWVPAASASTLRRSSASSRNSPRRGVPRRIDYRSPGSFCGYCETGWLRSSAALRIRLCSVAWAIG